jgi:hypothetical protein
MFYSLRLFQRGLLMSRADEPMFPSDGGPKTGKYATPITIKCLDAQFQPSASVGFEGRVSQKGHTGRLAPKLNRKYAVSLMFER